MKLLLALMCGKFLSKIGELTGRGTNLPGELILKIYPDLLGDFTYKGKIIAVTGSNGKTTTANMLAFILRRAGYKVAFNQKGSNLTGGVATTIMNHSDYSGYVDADFVVLEVDERFSRLIFKHFSPDYLLCTNLFRDQLTRNGNVDVIIEKLHEAIKPSVKLILNGNDPICANLAPANKRVYYGMNRTPLSTDTCFNITHDAKVCPKCFSKMNYDYFHYNHIGAFACSSCGYKTPHFAYEADEVDCDTGSFSISGEPVKTEYKSLFNVLNITAAVAAACELGLPLKDATRYVSDFKIMKQRYDEFEVDGRKAVMLLSKNQNPVSYDQSISYLLSLEGEKTAVIVVNNINHTNHRDTTWLYDISFERLLHQVDCIICSGTRACDLAVRLKLAGFESDQIKIEKSYNKLKPIVLNTKGTICILTELYDAHAILNEIK